MSDTYSTPSQIRTFRRSLGLRPFWVCDLDGNVMSAYGLAAGRALPLAARDNPQNQGIPFGTSPEAISEMVQAGTLERKLFADKSMDVRLPPALVDIVNRNLRTDDRFSLGFLTSRFAAEALVLLKESGVHTPERVTLVADSGATLYLGGQMTEVRKLSPAEKKFFDGLDADVAGLNRLAREAVAQTGHATGPVPELYIERKSIEINIHHREILRAFAQPEGSPLDRAIGGKVRDWLQAYAKSGPVDAAGKPVFKTLDGPATIGIKIADINKGHGLAALTEAAMASRLRPSSVVFCGDDIAKLADGAGMPGTDYYGMAWQPAADFRPRVKRLNVHTHHPAGGALDGAMPDPNKSPALLPAAYPQPRIDLVVPNPDILGRLIISSLTGSAIPAPFPALRHSGNSL